MVISVGAGLFVRERPCRFEVYWFLDHGFASPFCFTPITVHPQPGRLHVQSAAAYNPT
jgi:hypothetical protein